MPLEAPPLERKLVAILAVDVVGYSRLMHADEEATLAAFSAHRALIDEIVNQNRGRVCGAAGDSFLVEFGSVVAAFRCAVSIQRTVARANQSVPEDVRLLFRIGINVGDVMVKDENIFGDGVNIAARLEALAPPGGICVTRGVRDHLRDRIEAQFEDLGEHQVKNIARPVRVFKIAFDPLAEDDWSMLPPEEPPALSNGTNLPREPDEVEIAFWNSVKEGDDPAEYQVYLDHYPEGQFADLARARLQRVTTSAESENSEVIEVAFWNSIADSEDAAMFEAYLEKYPNGSFVTLAKARLDQLAASAQQSKGDPAIELAFWSSVADSDNPAMFEAYLQKYPSGEFTELAKLRLAELRTRSNT